MGKKQPNSRVREVRRRQLIVAVTYLLLLLLVFTLFKKVIYRNPSISEPVGYYLAVPGLSFNKNDLVMTCISNNGYKHVLNELGLADVKGQCTNGLPYLIKRISAVSGDMVEVVSDGILINGVLQPNSKQYAEGRGIKLYPLPVGYHHLLAADEYFMLGNSLHSFDSRYFGMVNRKDVYRKVILINLTSIVHA